MAGVFVSGAAEFCPLVAHVNCNSLRVGEEIVDAFGGDGVGVVVDHDGTLDFTSWTYFWWWWVLSAMFADASAVFTFTE